MVRAFETRFSIPLIVGLKCIPFLLAGLLFAACSSGTELHRREPSTQPVVTISALSNDARLETAVHDDAIVINIYSESGIGGAELAMPHTDGRPQVVLQVHLKGLEMFELSYDNRAIRASIGSVFPYDLRESATIGGESEGEIDDSSPYWMDVSIVSSEAESTIPLEEGFFRIELPYDYTKGNFESFSLNWIDFYR